MKSIRLLQIATRDNSSILGEPRICESAHSLAILEQIRAKIESDLNDALQVDRMYLSNNTPIFNQMGPYCITGPIRGVWYCLPKDDFVLPGYEGSLKLISGQSSFQMITKDYVLISVDGLSTNNEGLPLLALRLLSDRESLEQITVDEEETMKRLSIFSTVDMVPKSPSETDAQYNERIVSFREALMACPAIIEEVSSIVGVNFEKFGLKEIIMFCKYYLWLGDDDRKKKLLSALKNGGDIFLKHFMAGFEICEFEPANGELLMRLLERQGSRKTKDVISYYGYICHQVEDDEREEKLLNPESSNYLTRYYVNTKKAAARMIAASISMGEDERVDDFLLKTKKYLQDNIYIGSLLSDILERSGEEGLTTDVMDLLDACRLVVLSTISGGNKIGSMSAEDMFKPENYLTDDFTLKDYLMVIENISEAYTDIDPEWRDILIENIANDLENTNVRFVMIRVRDANLEGDYKVAAIMKVKPQPQGQSSVFYIGTLYVVPALQQYGLADFVQDRIEKVIETEFANDDNYVYWGAVSIFNTAMQRHIEKAGGIVTAITKEYGVDKESKELFQVEFHHDVIWKSKSLKKRDIIDQLCGRDVFFSSNIVEGDIIFMLADTRVSSNGAFLETVNRALNDGYVITRFFYHTENGALDHKRTYIVFEKPEMPISPACY